MKILLYKENIKKVFILEDAKDRIKYFNKLFSDKVELTITKRAGIAINELRDTKYDLIFLDHDLDEINIYNENDEAILKNHNNGYEVAKSLRDSVNKYTQIIVHSLNPVGAANIIQAHPFNIVHIPMHLLINNIEFI